MRTSKHKKHKLTATIYDKKGNVLSVGVNSYKKSHPMMAKYGKDINQHKIFIHAEVDAILRCMRNNTLHKAHRIFVERYSAVGNPMNGEPCEICKQVIKHETNIKIVEFTVKVNYEDSRHQ
jgi:deoxycytidylate deaminase